MTALLDSEAPVARAQVARLRVDQGDPFFFDHPLDHVPGMLIVCGMLDAARAGTEVGYHGRVQGSATFRSMCELDPAPVVWYPGGAERGEIRVTQYDRTVADGWFTFADADDDPPRHDSGVDPDRWAPAAAALVHRTHAENILIGDPRQAGDDVTAGVLPPPRGHRLADRDPDAYPVECLVEAGRQLSTWLPHHRAGWPLDTRMLWIGMTVDLPVRLPRSLAVALRWRVAPITGDKAKFHLDLIHADGRGPALGSLCFASKLLSPAQYTEFRADAGHDS